MHHLSKIEIMNRNNPAERNSVIEAEYSNGTKQTFNLLNNVNVQTFNINPSTESTYIKLTIKGVYTTLTNGNLTEII